MIRRVLRTLAIVDVIGIPAAVMLFIWRLQFTSPNFWIVFPVWIAASFLAHRDTPKTLGWRAENLGAAFRQAVLPCLLLAASLATLWLVLGTRNTLPANFFSLRSRWAYFAFCLLQQVALNSLITNRLVLLTRKPYAASLLAGAIFAIIHWPNPVLVPCTFVAGSVMAWLFIRQRNIIPLALMQVLLSAMAWWSLPAAWHHRMRVGPHYFRTL